MPTGYYRGTDMRAFYFNGQPTATLYENVSHDGATTDTTAALATGVMTSVAVLLEQGDVVTSCSVLVGATAISAPSHAWAQIYNSASTPAAVGTQSVDVASLTAAANSVVKFTFGATYTVPTTGIYYIGIGITATTVPSLVTKATGLNATGTAALNTALSFPTICQTSGSALGASAPATIASPTTQVACPLVIVQ